MITWREKFPACFVNCAPNSIVHRVSLQIHIELSQVKTFFFSHCTFVKDTLYLPGQQNSWVHAPTIPNWVPHPMLPHYSQGVKILQSAVGCVYATSFKRNLRKPERIEIHWRKNKVILWWSLTDATQTRRNRPWGETLEERTISLCFLRLLLYSVVKKLYLLYFFLSILSEK